MSGELDELAAAVAGVLVSVLAGDSWEDATQWFAAVVGHERRLAATRAKLVAANGGPDRDMVMGAPHSRRFLVSRSTACGMSTGSR